MGIGKYELLSEEKRGNLPKSPLIKHNPNPMSSQIECKYDKKYGKYKKSNIRY